MLPPKLFPNSNKCSQSRFIFFLTAPYLNRVLGRLGQWEKENRLFISSTTSSGFQTLLMPCVHQSVYSVMCLLFFFFFFSGRREFKKCSTLGKASHSSRSLFTLPSNHSGGVVWDRYHTEQLSHPACTTSEQQWRRSLISLVSEYPCVYQVTSPDCHNINEK